MIKEVSYERVFNLGNYENHRISAVATVHDGDVHAAYAECRAAVLQQHDMFLTERKAEQERQEAEWQRQREEDKAQWQRQQDKLGYQQADDSEDEEDDDDTL